MSFRTVFITYLATVVTAYFIILIISRTIPPIITIPLLLPSHK